MELRALQYFLVVAREENITKASQLLHLTQPTLSRQIMQLEAELGVKLFHRSNHSIILTEDGMRLKRRAQEILSLADKTKQDFQKEKVPFIGEIAIGSGEFLNTGYVAGIMAAFKKQYPLIRYTIYSGNADGIKDNIERGLLDIGIMMEPIDIRKYDFISLPLTEVWGVLVSEDSPFASKDSITPQELSQFPLITSSNELARSHVFNWFGEYRKTLNVVATGNLLYNEAMLAVHQMGAVLCMKLQCSYDGLKFLSLSPSWESRVVMVWKKDQILSPITNAFIQHTKKYVKRISEDKL